MQAHILTASHKEEEIVPRFEGIVSFVNCFKLASVKHRTAAFLVKVHTIRYSSVVELQQQITEQDTVLEFIGQLLACKGHF